ncbi:MAG TPA: urease subunit beta [Nitrospiria bacterium]|nr:urease subunit beta [Nitrospiria bacterium]
MGEGEKGSRQIIPGEYILAEGEIVALEGRATVTLTVTNTGDRPIQVGSHFHFFEANRALRFDRAKAFGFRLEIPAGTAMRFEPGEDKVATLTAFAGARRVWGLNGLTNGALDDAAVRRVALDRARQEGFQGAEADP